VSERDPLVLVHAVLDGAADEAEHAALEAWLKEDPANVRAYARAAYLYQQTATLLEEDDLRDLVGRAKPEDASDIDTGGGGKARAVAPGSAPAEPVRRRRIGLAIAGALLVAIAGAVGYFVAQIELADDPLLEPMPTETTEREHTGDAGRAAYDRWSAYSAQLRQDPDLLLYFAFEPDARRPSVLPNQATATADRFDGRLGTRGVTLSAPTWTNGRFPGKSALDFFGPGKQHVVIPHAEGLNLIAPCTVSMWLYNDTPLWTAHLLTKRFYKPDGSYFSNLAIAWIGVDPIHHGGQRTYYHTFEFGDVGPNRAWTGPHESPQGLPDAPRWVNLTITYDGQQIVYYLDGQRTDTKPVQRNHAMAAIDGDLILGDSTTAGSQLKNSFDGRIDELVMLGRVWTDDEARAFYEAGKPAP